MNTNDTSLTAVFHRPRQERYDGVIIKHICADLVAFVPDPGYSPVIFAHLYDEGWCVCVHFHEFTPDNAEEVNRCHAAAIKWCREQGEV